MKKTGLYVHVPFCVRKCLYCDFFSANYGEGIKEKYIKELSNELCALGNKATDREITTVYIGGGTPSCLSVKHIETIVETIKNNFNTNIKEFTIEINPNSHAPFGEYRAMGINRVSIGIQSLDDDLLKRIGRLHNAREAVECLDEANKFFDNISADIMIGLSEEQDVEKDLNIILPNVKHLSSYMLKIEDGTPLKKLVQSKKVAVATEEATVKQYNKMYEVCERKGFLRYEVSNFALSGYASQHNSGYWKLDDYYGVGPSAHSYIDGVRYYNEANIDAYLQGKHSGNNLQVPERNYSVLDEKEEYIMLALRTDRGLAIKEFEERFFEGFLQVYADKIDKIKQYLDIDDSFVKIKKEYVLVQNSIIAELI